MELATTNNHEPPTYLGFFLLHCCVAKATSTCSSTYTYDRESMSLELSSSAILHQERVNKVFGSVLRDCSIASPSLSSRLIYLFVNLVRSIITSTVNSVSLRTIFRNLLLSRKTRKYLTLESCLTY
jgi:hypothetical protein